MCSVPLDLFSMLELGGQQPSSAMISMNQLTTGHHLANRRAARKKTTGIPNPKRMFEEVLSLFLLLFAESNNVFVPVEFFHSLTKTLKH